MPPVQKTTTPVIETGAKHATGCFICGNDIIYLSEEQSAECFYCKKVFHTHTLCTHEHYVCDRCHSRDALHVIQEMCLQSNYSDVIGLFKKIRSHPAVPMHGPEQHSLVPAVILSVYRNLGGDVSENDILTAIERGNNRCRRLVCLSRSLRGGQRCGHSIFRHTESQPLRCTRAANRAAGNLPRA